MDSILDNYVATSQPLEDGADQPYGFSLVDIVGSSQPFEDGEDLMPMYCNGSNVRHLLSLPGRGTLTCTSLDIITPY